MADAALPQGSAISSPTADHPVPKLIDLLSGLMAAHPMQTDVSQATPEETAKGEVDAKVLSAKTSTTSDGEGDVVAQLNNTVNQLMQALGGNKAKLPDVLGMLTGAKGEGLQSGKSIDTTKIGHLITGVSSIAKLFA